MNPAPTTPLAVVVDALREANNYGSAQAPFALQAAARALLAKLAETNDEVYQRGVADGEKWATGVPDPVCAKCGYGSAEHGLTGHPAYGCIWAPALPRGNALPAILFDSNAVYAEVDQRKTSPENVCDVLDAVVRIMKREQPR